MRKRFLSLFMTSLLGVTFFASAMSTKVSASDLPIDQGTVTLRVCNWEEYIDEGVGTKRKPLTWKVETS